MVVSIQRKTLTHFQPVTQSTRKREPSVSGQKRRLPGYWTTPYPMTPPRHWQTCSRFTMMFRKMGMLIHIRCVGMPWYGRECVCVCVLHDHCAVNVTQIVLMISILISHIHFPCFALIEFFAPSLHMYLSHSLLRILTVS